MNLAVSNIAWPAHERHAAYAALAEFGVSGLEIAPGLLFSGAEDVFVPGEARLAEVQTELRDAGLELVSMQSLLFGVQGAALFGDKDEQARFHTAMMRAINLAGRLSIPNLVFGSPLQRIRPDSLTMQQAFDQAANTFRTLGDAALQAGCRIAMEPNPAAYGTNFLTHTEDALSFVEYADHSAITLNFDVGAMHMNGDFDRVEELASRAAPRISHVHFSEPQLGPAPAEVEQVERVLTAGKAAGYQGWYSIEMKAPATSPIENLRKGLATLTTAARRFQA